MSNLDPSEVTDLSQAPGLLETIASAGFDVRPGPTTPILNAQTIAAAVVGRAGGIVAASAAFTAMDGGRHIDIELLDRAARGATPATAVVEFGGDDGLTDSAIFAYARADLAQAWRLPPDVQAAAAVHPHHVVILTSRAAPGARPLADACRAYGLNGLQTRVALETIRTGHIRSAAVRLGISYDTAREAMAEAMRRSRARRLPALVNQLTSLAFGVFPEGDGAEILGDLWGLTARQAAIAGLVAEGFYRPQAAVALGLSEAVVKKELDRVYLILQVGTGAALARKIVEANALRWLTRATGGDIGFVEEGAEPLQFAARPGGGRIAFSDYGPASGKPLLVVHSSMTTRPVARGLLRALQAAGYRPIAIDRPGFGLSDEVPGMRPGLHDPAQTAAADAQAVLDLLKIRAVDVVARGGAQFVLALARAAPERLGRVVLVNPDPHGVAGGRGLGGWRIMKQAWRRNPALIRLTVQLVIQQFTFERFFAVMQRGVRGSPPDEAATRDPEIVRDYFRAQRTFATGRIGGCVNEQTAIAGGTRPEPLAGAATWRVLVSAHDVIHEPGKVVAYWRAVLPDARFEVVPDTGRLLAMTHPGLVVEALIAP